MSALSVKLFKKMNLAVICGAALMVLLLPDCNAQTFDTSPAVSIGDRNVSFERLNCRDLEGLNGERGEAQMKVLIVWLNGVLLGKEISRNGYIVPGAENMPELSKNFADTALQHLGIQCGMHRGDGIVRAFNRPINPTLEKAFADSKGNNFLYTGSMPDFTKWTCGEWIQFNTRNDGYSQIFTMWLHGIIIGAHSSEFINGWYDQPFDLEFSGSVDQVLRNACPSNESVSAWSIYIKSLRK